MKKSGKEEAIRFLGGASLTITPVAIEKGEGGFFNWVPAVHLEFKGSRLDEGVVCFILPGKWQTWETTVREEEGSRIPETFLRKSEALRGTNQDMITPDVRERMAAMMARARRTALITTAKRYVRSLIEDHGLRTDDVREALGSAIVEGVMEA